MTGSASLFSWKRNQHQDDYHTYEMTVASRQSASGHERTGRGWHSGTLHAVCDRILYHSTRCVSVVDCNEKIDGVNLYTCNMNGEDVVRLTYGQVFTQFPTILADGRIVYTRWDYNDRGQIYPQGLFTMNMDGTRQTALYGNNSWYPTSLIQTRSNTGDF